MLADAASGIGISRRCSTWHKAKEKGQVGSDLTFSAKSIADREFECRIYLA